MMDSYSHECVYTQAEMDKLRAERDELQDQVRLDEDIIKGLNSMRQFVTAERDANGYKTLALEAERDAALEHWKACGSALDAIAEALGVHRPYESTDDIEAAARQALARAEKAEAQLASAQAVIDAAQKMVVAFRTGSTWEQAVKLFDAVLAAHLEKYPR